MMPTPRTPRRWQRSARSLQPRSTSSGPTLTSATQGVVTAQKDVGFALQDMADEDKRTALSAGDIDVLNKAYKRFNNTTQQRKAIVADVTSPATSS